MNDWWYLEKDKKIGPIKTDEFSKLCLNGKITLNTIVWQEGMLEWKRLEDIDLASLKSEIPSPLPLKLANRWPRFFARYFDLLLESIVLIIALTILGIIFPVFIRAIISTNAVILGIILFPVVLLFDALISKIAGNTPGKAILGLKVLTLDNKPLTLSQYLARNSRMWVTGFAFGIPLIYLFTFIYQALRLGKKKPASYDESIGCRVYAAPLGWKRISLFVILFAMLVIFVGALILFGVLIGFFF
ncbi:MAG: RDD family protein [Chromatiales bacterium]|nr:RDD family protein [Chromatiales bacterium]